MYSTCLSRYRYNYIYSRYKYTLHPLGIRHWAGCAAAYGMYLAIATGPTASGRSVAEVREGS